MKPSRVVALYQLGARLARVLPTPIIKLGLQIAPTVLRRLIPHHVAQLRLHQQRLAAGLLSPTELEQRVTAALRSYANYWLQSFRLSGLGADRIADHIHVEGQQFADAALDAGSGAICVMPHIGLWDLGGAWLASKYPLTVVAERLEPPELFDWFVKMRAKNEMEVVALGDPDSGTRLLARLRSGGFVGLLCDRDITHEGVEVMFFGETTTLSAGPAMLSLRTGAPLLPTAVYARPGQKARGVIGPPIQFERTGRLRDDVAKLTQVVAIELEQLIRRAPEQWHVLQPNWPSDPQRKEKPEGLGDEKGRLLH
jgi:phosphatidylinositol dimannoside acyltransferase